MTLDELIAELLTIEADVRRIERRDGCTYPDVHARIDAQWARYLPMLVSVATTQPRVEN